MKISKNLLIALLTAYAFNAQAQCVTEIQPEILKSPKSDQWQVVGTQIGWGDNHIFTVTVDESAFTTVGTCSTGFQLWAASVDTQGEPLLLQNIIFHNNNMMEAISPDFGPPMEPGEKLALLEQAEAFYFEALESGDKDLIADAKTQFDQAYSILEPMFLYLAGYSEILEPTNFDHWMFWLTPLVIDAEGLPVPLTNVPISDLSHAAAKRPKAKPKYTWKPDVKVNDKHCKNKTPEQCANERLTAATKKICSNPKLKDHCNKLREWITKKKLTVVCALTGEGGNTDPTSLDIKLNGDLLITDVCATATIVHELEHVLDFSKTPPKKWQEYKKSLADRNKLEKDLANEKANAPITPTEKLAQEREIKRLDVAIAKISRKIRILSHDAGAERIAAECRAFSFVRGISEFFKGESAGDFLMWLQFEMLSTYLEMKSLFIEFGKGMDPGPKKALCECLKKWVKWMETDPTFKKVKIAADMKLYKKLRDDACK